MKIPNKYCTIVKKYTSILFVLLPFLLWQCSSDPLMDTESSDSRYSLDRLFAIGCHDVDAAIAFIDEGKAKGELTDFEAADLCAHLTFHLSKDYPKVMEYCKQALSALEEQGNPVFYVQSYGMLGMAYYECDDMISCLEICSDAMEATHECNYVFGDAFLDFMVGKCQFDCGLYEDGFSHMNDAVERGMKTVHSEKEYGMQLYMLLKLYESCFSYDDPEEMLRVANLLEPLLNGMEKKYPGLKTGCSLGMYHRGEYAMYLCCAVAKASLGRLSEAKEDFQRCRDMEYAAWDNNYRYQIDYYMAIGAVDSVLSITERYPYQYGDTVTWLYQMRLARIERAYRIKGDTVLADSYAFRMDTLAEIIENRELEEGLAITATQYNSKHYHLAFSNLEDTFKKYSMFVNVFITVVTLFIIACVVYLIIYSKWRNKSESQLRQKTQTLEEEMKKLRKQVRLITRKRSPMGGEENAAALASFVEKNELYLKKGISRSMVADLMGCSQRVMTKMLNEIHPGLSFPDYIRSLRIRHALTLISENPNYSVQQVADESGFYSISSFERAFKAVMGKTPKAYLMENGVILEENTKQ